MDVGGEGERDSGTTWRRGKNLMGPFEYFEPETVEEALSLLRKYADRAKVSAGGTNLVVQLRKRLLNPQCVISIGGIRELDYHRFGDEKDLRIGCLTTIRTIERSPELQRHYKMLSEVASQMSSVAVRNVATIGGNLCNALPLADMAPMLIALSAKAKLVSIDGERIVPLENFFTGPGKTVLRADELMVEIQIIPPLSQTAGAYLKYTTRGGEELAVVGVAAVATCGSRDGGCSDVRIVLGTVVPAPMRAKEAEAILKGKRIDDELIGKAARIAVDESRPRDSIRGSGDYRREMVRILTRDALRQAFERAQSAR
jgi:carbon-monoxide dehydrogenase medium subunit